MGHECEPILVCFLKSDSDVCAVDDFCSDHICNLLRSEGRCLGLVIGILYVFSCTRCSICECGILVDGEFVDAAVSRYCPLCCKSWDDLSCIWVDVYQSLMGEVEDHHVGVCV